MMMNWTPSEIEIMRRALPAVEAVPPGQDKCWPGDGPAHDDHCKLTDHTASLAAVTATEGISWNFDSWSSVAYSRHNGYGPTPAEAAGPGVWVASYRHMAPSDCGGPMLEEGDTMGNYIDDYLRHLFKNLCLTLIFRLQSVRE